MDDIKLQRRIRDHEIAYQKQQMLENAHEAAGEFVKMQEKFNDEKAQQLDMARAQTRIYESKIREGKEQTAKEEAEAAAQRASEGASIWAMRDEIRDRTRRETEERNRANRWIRATMANRAQQLAESQRERAAERRAARGGAA